MPTAYIANFQSPFDIQELEWFYERGTPTNLGSILEVLPGKPLGEWSAPRWAKTGDLAFFMCATTSTSHIGHVCKQARDSGNERLVAYAEKERALYKQFAGKIVAVGRVAAEPYKEEGAGPQALKWAPIRNFIRFDRPITREEYIDFVKVSRTGSITKLDEQQAEKLLTIAKTNNPEMPIKDFKWGLSDEPTAYGAITRFAGQLSREPGTMHCIDNTPDHELWRYQMSDVMREFDQTFFDSGLLDPEYDQNLESAGIWTIDTDIKKLDVSEFDAPTVLSILTASTCDNWYQEGNLLYVAQSGLLDRCLLRLAEIAGPSIRPARVQPIAAFGFSRPTRRFLQRLGVRDSDDLALLDASQIEDEGADAAIIEEVRPYLATVSLANGRSLRLRQGNAGRGKKSEVNLTDCENQPDAPNPALRLRHIALADFLTTLNLDESSFRTSDGLRLVADALLIDSNTDLCLHSADRQSLRALAKETASAYEEFANGMSSSDAGDVLDGKARGAEGSLNQPTLAVEGVSQAPPARALEHKLNLEVLPAPLQSALGNVETITAEAVLSMGADGIKESLGLTDRSAKRLMRAAIEQREDDSLRDIEMPEAGRAGLLHGRQKEEGASSIHARVRRCLVDLSASVIVSPLAVVPYVLSNTETSALQGAIVDSLVEYALHSSPWGLSQTELVEFTRSIDADIASTDLDAALERLSGARRAFCDSDVWISGDADLILSVETHVKSPLRRQLLLAVLAADSLDMGAALYGIDGNALKELVAEEYRAGTFARTRVSRLVNCLSEFDLDEGMVVNGLHARMAEWELSSTIVCSMGMRSRTLRPASDLLSDSSMPLRLRLDLEREVYRDLLRIDDEYVEATPEALLLHTLKTRCGDHAVNPKMLAQRYALLLDDLGLDDRQDLGISQPDIDALRLHRCVLVGLKLSLKYYEYERSKVASLVSSLCLEDFDGREVSTALFLSTKPEVLKEHEIDDAYQLHSLLRTYTSESADIGEEQGFAVGKAPLINVGRVNRERQVIELARELSPVSVTDFAHAYEARYGVSWTIVRVEFVPSFLSVYVKNGTIALRVAPLSGTERRKLASSLTEDFYKMSRIERIFKTELPGTDETKLNALSLQLLGYEVHGSCALRRTWDSPDAYFSSLALSSEFFDERSLTQDVLTSDLYRHYLKGAIRARNLLPYDDNSLISLKGLAALEIGESDLLEFAGAVARFCERQGVSYCTVKSLARRGFDHELLEYGMAEEFYAAVLCSDGTRFSALSCNHKTIACLDGAYVAIAAVIEALVEDGEAFEVEELVETAFEVLGVTVTRQNVLSAPKKTDLYYCEASDMIYKDKATFIRKVV